MAVYEFTCKKCGTEFEVSCHMDERDAQGGLPQVRQPQGDAKAQRRVLLARPSKY